MDRPELYCCIPARDASTTLGRCLRSLAEQDHGVSVRTLICVNASSDGTESVARELAAQYPQLRTRLAWSRKGIAFALNAMVRMIDSPGVPVAFIDADVVLDTKCLGVLMQELHCTDGLVVAGAWPVPLADLHASLWQRILYHVLHARSLHPQAEVSRFDVSLFKPYVDRYPQPAVPPAFERRSRIYFHGRTYMIRSAEYFDLPEADDTVDDTYLSNAIHLRYGPGAIRTRYDARVYYDPYRSLSEHFRAYRRYFVDKVALDMAYPEFRWSRLREQTKLDWQYILGQGLPVSAAFAAHWVVHRSEDVIFRLLPRARVSALWTK